jgi:hypothetical protein
MPDGGLERYVSNFNKIADLMSEKRGEKLGKRMDIIVVQNS